MMKERVRFQGSVSRVSSGRLGQFSDWGHYRSTSRFDSKRVLFCSVYRTPLFFCSAQYKLVPRNRLFLCRTTAQVFHAVHPGSRANSRCVASGGVLDMWHMVRVHKLRSHNKTDVETMTLLLALLILLALLLFCQHYSRSVSPFCSVSSFCLSFISLFLFIYKFMERFRYVCHVSQPCFIQL